MEQKENRAINRTAALKSLQRQIETATAQKYDGRRLSSIAQNVSTLADAFMARPEEAEHIAAFNALEDALFELTEAFDKHPHFNDMFLEGKITTNLLPIVGLLKSFEPDKRLFVIRILSKEIGSTIENTQQLKRVLKCLPLNDRIKAIYALGDQLPTIIGDVEQLESLLKYLPETKRSAFRLHMVTSYRSLIKSYDQLQGVLERLDEADAAFVVSALANAGLLTLLPINASKYKFTDSIANILNRLPFADRSLVMTALQARFHEAFSTFEHFKTALDLLPEENQGKFAAAFSKNPNRILYGKDDSMIKNKEDFLWLLNKLPGDAIKPYFSFFKAELPQWFADCIDPSDQSDGLYKHDPLAEGKTFAADIGARLIQAKLPPADWVPIMELLGKNLVATYFIRSEDHLAKILTHVPEQEQNNVIAFLKTHITSSLIKDSYGALAFFNKWLPEWLFDLGCSFGGLNGKQLRSLFAANAMAEDVPSSINDNLINSAESNGSQGNNQPSITRTATSPLNRNQTVTHTTQTSSLNDKQTDNNSKTPNEDQAKGLLVAIEGYLKIS